MRAECGAFFWFCFPFLIFDFSSFEDCMRTEAEEREAQGEEIDYTQQDEVARNWHNGKKQRGGN
jgi:hypothetical protein